MANSDKNILITPNKNASGIPEIALTGFGNSTISANIPDSNIGTLNFSTSTKNIFSIDSDQNSNIQLSIGSTASGSFLELKNFGNLSINTPKTTIYGKGLKLSKVKPTTSPSINGKIAYDSVQKTLVVSNSTTWTSYSSPTYVQDGLIVYYDASRPDSYPGSGSVVYDISGSSIGSGEMHGTMGNVGFSTERGGALTFNGSNSYIDVNNSSDLLRDFSGYTVEWYTKITTATACEIFGNYGPSFTTNYLWIAARYGHYLNGSNPYFVAGPYTEAAPLEPGYTYHGAVTRDPQTRNTMLYLNGFLNTSSTADARIGNGINYRIGLDVNSSTAEPFGGSLYLIRVYNRPLTPKEIQINFESARTRVGL